MGQQQRFFEFVVCPNFRFPKTDRLGWNPVPKKCPKECPKNGVIWSGNTDLRHFFSVMNVVKTMFI